MSHHETTIIGGALDLTLKTAKDAMTPISETFSLDINSKLDMYVRSSTESVHTIYFWFLCDFYMYILTLGIHLV